MSIGLTTGSLHRCSCFRELFLPHRQSFVAKCRKNGGRLLRRQLSVRAAEGERFNETAASVRRLLKRDRKDLQSSSATYQPEWDDIPEDPEAQATVRRAPASPSTSAPASQGKVTPNSPFGSAGDPFQSFSSNGKAKSPFGGSSKTANPFGDTSDLYTEAEPMEADDKEWWQNIGLGQVVLALSFVLAGGLMFATFYVTLKLGGISLNE